VIKEEKEREDECKLNDGLTVRATFWFSLDHHLN